MENKDVSIVAVADSYKELKKKYPIAIKEINYFIEEKCKYYSKMDEETLEKFGFENGRKYEYIKKIADFILLVNENYKKIDTNYDEDDPLKKIIRNYLNKEDLSKQLLELQPLYYDENKLWWFWNKKEFKWEITDETNILNFVRELSFANTINSKDKNEIVEALKQEARTKKPIEAKNTWVQFKDIIVNIITGEEIKASPKYFITNPIPYAMSKNKFYLTPKIDKIFEEWVGKEHVQTLYEIIAYSLIPNYPLHRIFCLIGGGMNGKSCFLNLLKKFIGQDNCCSTELDTLLTSRFEVTRLHKKLVCIMGETNFSEMSKTSILKKLSGGDLIGFEYKNKNPFQEVNYAKIMIATNNLPTTTDKTIGFYRRWLIIDFPNQFSEKKDILAEIPEEEYECLTIKCLMILKDLLENKEFYNEGTIEDRMKKYEDHSDPLEKFIKEFTEEDIDGCIWKFEFEKKLNEWCKENQFRQLSEIVVGRKMKEKGIEQGLKIPEWSSEGQRKQIRAWLGLKWRLI